MVGGGEARRLGPWSSAYELSNAREGAAAAREERLRAAAAAAPAGAQAAAARWAPREGGGARGRFIPPLFSLCLDLLVDHVGEIDSLWGLPDAIRGRLAAAVCAKRRLSPAVAALFADGGATEVLLPSCTQLEAPAMAALLAAVATPRLERLELGACGRGLGDDAAAAAARKGPLSALEVRAVAAAAAPRRRHSPPSYPPSNRRPLKPRNHTHTTTKTTQSLSLGGAYRLTDAGAAALLAAAPRLARLALPQASLLGGALLGGLPSTLVSLDLTDCRGVAPAALAAALPRLPALERLVIDGWGEADDALIATIASAAPALTELSARCADVGDDGVVALAAGRPGLTALALDDAFRLTDAALAALAERCRGLASLSLRRCARLSDGGLAALAERCALRHLDVSGVVGAGRGLTAALGRACHETLETLDVSFCRSMGDDELGPLADACRHLRLLRVFGCSSITSSFVCGHRSEALSAPDAIVGVGVLG